MLSYLVNCIHPGMSYAVQQRARLFNCPKHSHEQAVKRILKYLIWTTRNKSSNNESNQEIIFSPDRTRSIDDNIDKSFAGEWNSEWSDDSTSVIWCSKLMTEIALLTTENEYIAMSLSQSMRDVIPLMELLKELKEVVPANTSAPIIHCTIFEDNKGYIDLV